MSDGNRFAGKKKWGLEQIEEPIHYRKVQQSGQMCKFIVAGIYVVVFHLLNSDLGKKENSFEGHS